MTVGQRLAQPPPKYANDGKDIIEAEEEEDVCRSRSYDLNSIMKKKEGASSSDVPVTRPPLPRKRRPYTGGGK